MVELVSDDWKLFCPKKIQTSKLSQSTRVVKIEVYYAIRPFKSSPGTKAPPPLRRSGENPGQEKRRIQDVIRRWDPLSSEYGTWRTVWAGF